MSTSILSSIFGFIEYYFILIDEMYIRALVFLSLSLSLPLFAYLYLLKKYNVNLYILIKSKNLDLKCFIWHES